MVLVPSYILILFFLISLDYFLAIEINKRESNSRKWLLITSIIANVGTLFFFKYFNFFNENISSLANVLHWNYSPYLLSVVLPFGLSFHVFQSLSSVIEVYRKNYSPEKNYLTYALYVMFFPQLVAGPIERPAHLLPQLSANHDFDSVRARKGLERMLWGFFKKLVIADQIAQIINPLFANLPVQHGPVLALMAILFTYQLYCDFSGYTDIALGAAMTLGIDLRENFNRPFAATSFADFWHRWHMSLSTWFRDYVYFSLGGSKVTKIKWIRNIMVTFLLSGFWHGANWTFIAWGGINGIYLTIEHFTERLRKRFISVTGLVNSPSFYRVISTLAVFLLIVVSFIFFRAESISQAWWIITHLFTDMNIGFIRDHLLTDMTKVSGNIIFMIVIMSIVLMEVVQYFQAKGKNLNIFDDKPRILRYGWYYFLVFSILLFGWFGSQSFIYFQF